MIEALAPLEPIEDARLFVQEMRGKEPADRLADHFLRRVSENALRA
jgi:hypothetical protein